MEFISFRTTKSTGPAVDHTYTKLSKFLYKRLAIKLGPGFARKSFSDNCL